jgi:hypothetical protein
MTDRSCYRCKCPLPESERRSCGAGKSYRCKRCDNALRAERRKRFGKSSRPRRYEPAKESARQKVARAVRSGALVRCCCQVCGANNAEAHHDDYAKPLDVRWLCRAHHAEWHSLNGEGKNSEGSDRVARVMSSPDPGVAS